MYRDEDPRLTADETPRDELLLDVCLEEILAGQKPPDLRAEILSKLDAVAGPLAEPPFVEPPVAPPPVQTAASASNGSAAVDIHATVVPSRQRVRASRSLSRQWFGVALAASVLLISLGIFVWQQSDRFVAVTPEVGNSVSNRGTSEVKTPLRTEQRTVTQSEGLVVGRFSEPLFGAEFPPVPDEQAVPWALPYAVEPQDDGSVVSFVNSQVVNTVGQTDDDQWCRQVFHQILGRQPSSIELVEFAADASPNKRATLVDRLLSGEKYQEEYAAHWAEIWANELLGAVKNASPEHRNALQSYLAESFRAGKAHDVLTTELLASQGTIESTGGAASFVMAAADDKARLTAQVSRVFLGHNGRCAQCHDGSEPSIAPGKLSQQQFWQLAAFFEQTHVTGQTPDESRLVNSDFVGLSGDVSEAELFYDTLDKHKKIAYPVFIDGTPINPDGRLEVVDRRAELAKLIVSSEEFAEATVNLYWQKVVGSGTPQSAAPGRLTQGLAEQFAAHDFDHKRLLRWMTLSDVPVDIDDSRTPLYEDALIALNDVRSQGRPVSRDDSVLFARAAPTNSPQELSIIAPAANRGVTSTKSDRTVRRLARSEMHFADKVGHVFLHTLGRQPDRQELAAARRMLNVHQGDVTSALDDIWWALTQTAEYQ